MTTPTPPTPPKKPSRPGLAAFTKQYAVLLTTYKRDGTRVGTPVSIVVVDDGDQGGRGGQGEHGHHAYFRTFGKSGKAKRMRNNPEVELAPCTVLGRPLGPGIRARVRLLDPAGEEAKRAAKLLARKHPFLHGVFVPLAHKAMRDRTLHYEVRVVGGG